jgi:hypothetical protein
MCIKETDLKGNIFGFIQPSIVHQLFECTPLISLCMLVILKVNKDPTLLRFGMLKHSFQANLANTHQVSVEIPGPFPEPIVTPIN